MKKIIVYTTFLVISTFVAAQQTPADKLFDKYSGKDGFTTVYISKYMFDLFRKMEDEENTRDKDDMEKVFSDLNSIKILTLEDPSLHPESINFYEEIMEELPLGEYEELMVIKEKGQDMKFLIKEKNDQIIELLLISGGVDSNVLISIKGDIDLESISKLSGAFEMEGMDNLEKIEK